MTAKLNVALIYGSTREGRFCDTIADWIAGEILSQDGFALDLVDPAQLDLPHRHEARQSPELSALKERLAAADAFVVVTPEYNHGYPAALKFLIDSVYEEWRGKPVAFVSYGGVSGGLRAVEQLRPVFAELHAMTIRDSVSFANPWEQFGPGGKLLQPERAAKTAALMLEQLQWWAAALREARDADARRLAAV
ncbi:FMN reductase [Capsulimonas corticalis]|uniref:FMN reductase n=1 Tax=Capsulimonas corticalis TaxID=2219043 RepID=A0A402CTM0_9BACT|nr:NAD(P)H-dependent oxidoreductase [Capsulimonas corticalis]BDI30699.1 FMN reductase [Capsulimonas corticalis]